jgi:hypothetical protein
LAARAAVVVLNLVCLVCLFILCPFIRRGAVGVVAGPMKTVVSCAGGLAASSKPARPLLGRVLSQLGLVLVSLSSLLLLVVD